MNKKLIYKSNSSFYQDKRDIYISLARIEKKESMIAYLSGMEARDLRSQLLVDKANLLDETESNEDTKP